MGKFEVTNEQRETMAGNDPHLFRDRMHYPVPMISWDDAEKFCRKVGARTGTTVRLPTEAEWEYACRAGTSTDYCTGDTLGGLDEVGWYSGNSGRTFRVVGQKNPNAWGLYDTHGNVFEWCLDWLGCYRPEAAVDPHGPMTGKFRGVRGGEFDCPAVQCRSRARTPGTMAPDCSHGFRVVVEVEPPKTP
jgi:formylglycine-generating enzyme required for sulfatase activity